MESGGVTVATTHLLAPRLVGPLKRAKKVREVLSSEDDKEDVLRFSSRLPPLDLTPSIPHHASMCHPSRTHLTYSRYTQLSSPESEMPGLSDLLCQPSSCQRGKT